MLLRFLRKSGLKRFFAVQRCGMANGLPREMGNQESNTSKELENSAVDEPARKPTWKCFSYEAIFQATNGFDSENLVGRGGYANVYRGVMEDGLVIAVKRLTGGCNERKEKEFLTELGTIGHVHHPNVLPLLGCCVENGLHLVFEFSLRGSVASLLHGENFPLMTWKNRYKIAIGTAKGLHYLHKRCRRRIIHRDIKTSNVLLTSDFEPQISDFGLAKWLPSQWSHHSVMPIEGTCGYLAPEYFMHGIVDEKTDVFAFGVFLLEIISGRKPVDGSHQSLLNWARPYLSKGIEVLVDHRLRGDYDIKQLKTLAFTASLCIRSSALWRPTMVEVLELLEDGEVPQDSWEMLDLQEEEFCDFDDLDWEGSDDQECQSSPFSTSLPDSVGISEIS